MKKVVVVLLVALFSGVAAAYSTARPGLMGALPGVAIAAALVPPIASAGIALATGEGSQALGAASLFGVNLILIILASAFTLFCMGVRSTSEESNQRVWAKRVIQFLLLISLVISFPLGTKMISGVSGDSGDIRKQILSTLPDNVHLLAFEFEYIEGRQLITVELGSANQLSAEYASSFTHKLRASIQPNAVIKVKLVQVWIDTPLKNISSFPSNSSSKLKSK